MDRLRELRTAHAVTTKFMRDQITKRRAEMRSDAADGAEGESELNDVFSMLVRANELEGKLKLDDQELVSDLCTGDPPY
jgi:hypothetical protein